MDATTPAAATKTPPAKPLLLTKRRTVEEAIKDAILVYSITELLSRHAAISHSNASSMHQLPASALFYVCHNLNGKNTILHDDG
jgi:hypothetical protein